MNAIDWSDAACRGHDPELWFRLDRRKDDRADTALALAICSACPIKEACLNKALTDEGGVNGVNRAGIFGGMSPTQRARTRPRAKLLAPCGTAGAARRHRRRGEPVCPQCKAACNDYYKARRAAA